MGMIFSGENRWEEIIACFPISFLKGGFSIN